MAPPNKRPRTNMAAAKAKDQPGDQTGVQATLAAAEPPKELEEDATICSQPKLKDPVRFLVHDTTLNVLQGQGGNVVMTLAEGGIQHFVAGVRANVGVSRGRYLFEVKVVENFVAFDSNSQLALGGGPPRLLLKLGVATSSSTLFFGENDQSMCFDTTGHTVYNKQRMSIGRQVLMGTGVVLGLLLNLDASTPNANTISLFRNGVRMCQPQLLPETLRGQALFPAIAFKNMTLHVNFGPHPMAPLPFSCRMVQDATKTDVSVAKEEVPADGKYEVIVPVGLPDQGTFDRLDMFLEKHPEFTELSDRMILQWAENSGLRRPHGYGPKARICNDRPGSGFGIRELDDDSVRRALYTIAPLHKRRFVVMEVNSNLLEDDRKNLLQTFSVTAFKRIADVVVGEPPADFKKRVQALMLKEKQDRMNAEHLAKKLAKERERTLARQVKQREKALKKAELLAKKRLAEAQAKVEAARRAAEKAAAEKVAGEGQEAEAETKDTKEPEEEEKREQPELDPETEEEAEEPAAPEEPVPKAELTADEKKLTFRQFETKDVQPRTLSANFAKYTLPQKAEGFDDVRYEWTKSRGKCDEILKEWILDMKANSRIEELAPSAWFTQKVSQGRDAIETFRQQQSTWRVSMLKKIQDRERKKAARTARFAAKEKKKQLAAEKAEKGEEAPAPKPEEEEAEAAAAAKDAEEEAAEEAQHAAEEEADAAFKKVNIFAVDDVSDVGGGLPLFKEFQDEDWALLTLTFELNLLAHAFAHDVADPERPGVHIDHLPFYYQRYFNKELRSRDFGVNTAQEVVNLIGDRVVYLSPKEVLSTQLGAEFESFDVFVKLIELARRHRILRIDLGDEEAKLKFQRVGGPRGERQSKGGKGDRRRGHKGGALAPLAPLGPVGPVGPVGLMPMPMFQTMPQKGSFPALPIVKGGKGARMGGKGGGGSRGNRGMKGVGKGMFFPF